MSRHTHHGAVAIAHEHIVAYPDRNRFSGQRMRNRQSGRHAFLFHRRHFRLGDATFLAVFNEDGEVWISGRRYCGEWMLRCHRAKGDAHDGVGTRGEHKQLAVLHEGTG